MAGYKLLFAAVETSLVLGLAGPAVAADSRPGKEPVQNRGVAGVTGVKVLKCPATITMAMMPVPPPWQPEDPQVVKLLSHGASKSLSDKYVTCSYHLGPVVLATYYFLEPSESCEVNADKNSYTCRSGK